MNRLPIGDARAARSSWPAVLRFARGCRYEPGHANQVTALATRLFDELGSLHGLGAEARFWLRCAGQLHDIGWAEGPRAHHKTSLRLILETPLLPFNPRERLVIGTVARYHRKALPSARHKHYAALAREDREIVSRLAALLRVADGLDCTHQNLIRDVSCEIGEKRIVIRCGSALPANEERRAALAKGDLMEREFQRELEIGWPLI
jgi:exopolyphosphatase/guanosine-5'-triphosphate,3'-diphosphate pyrophosphatase